MTWVLWIGLASAGVAGATAVLLAAGRRHRRQRRQFFDENVLDPAAAIVIGDRFRIERLVERGGMGVVYRALDRRTGEPVALKLLLRAGSESPSDERFAREARLLAGLNHRRVARYVAHGPAARGQAYLAMQWLEGEDLRTALARGPLSLADSLLVLTGAAEGLAVVHAQGIVHRDLKPGNLFLRGGSAADLVLLDFGLARQLVSETRVTGSATIVGTPQYMAPEQASGAPTLLPATDIFALGCIFHECLTGQPAFQGTQVLGVLARILFDHPRPASELRPSVPLPWAELLARMLRKPAAERPRDAQALLQEIAALPAPPPESAGAMVVAQGPLDFDSGDQVLVSVVLATVPGSQADDTARGAGDPGAFEALRAAMSRFHCPIERLRDGSVLATILPPHGATDQARIAARCALALRDLWPGARLAVTTGPASSDRSARIGDAVDRAARLVDSGVVQGSWEGIRLDSLTAGLLDARFVTSSRGDQLLLLAENSDLDDSRPLLGKPTPCVGREVELAQLESLMATVVEGSAPRAAVITGPPGIGKSRLRHELLRRLQVRYPALSVLAGYGDPLNAGSPFVLVSDALRRHAGIGASDPPDRGRQLLVERLCRQVAPAHRRRVSEFLGELCGIPFPSEDSPPLRAARGDDRVMAEQIALAFLDWLSAECAAHPLLLVLEDLQWGDALTVKLLEGALRDLPQGAVMVLALGRPEVEEAFPRLLAGHRAVSLSLQPLSARASELLVKEVLGEAIGGAPLARVVQLAGGNALFLEELIRAAVTGQVGDVPETVLAVLQARLSRLPPRARQVLRAGIIFGETFWRGAVARVCEQWSALHDVDAWLAYLVGEEILARRRHSRFAGEVEYAVRHQLVCEAAAGLSTAFDTRSAHQAAGRWLEEKGEPDGIVLAHHAEQGDERERAIPFYVRAAEQSMAQHDFAEALARADRGVACGAAGQALGILLSIRSSALYSTARWLETAEVGLAALPLLPAGGFWWCFTVEKLFQVLPNNGDMARYQQLVDQMQATPPAPDAGEAFVRALHVQLLAYAISGQYAKGQHCLDFIDSLDAGDGEQDIVARGYRGLWRAIFKFILGTDLSLALSLVTEAERDLGESQVMYRLSLACCLKSFIWWGFGALDRAEQAARRGLAIARDIGDDYQATQSTWYLGLSLCEQPDPAKLEEAEGCARSVMEAHISPIYDSFIPRVITARVAVTRNDWAKAESEGRIARSGLGALTPFMAMASADLMTALRCQGRAAEAAVIAREDLQRLDQVGGPMCTEVAFRVAAAEALYQQGDQQTARRLLDQALAQIDERSSLMTDPLLRESFLAQRSENRRARALHAAWTV